MTFSLRVGTREFQAQAGEPLRDALLRAGLLVGAPCAGQGVCGRCRVRVLAGEAAPPGPAERAALSEAELAVGWRLSCLSPVRSDVTLEVSPEPFSRLKAILSTQGRTLPLDPPSRPTAERHLGLAVDLGTTTLVVGLLDLLTGQILKVEVAPNPQRAWGEDVLRRALYASKPEGLTRLRAALAEVLGNIISGLVREFPGEIAETVAVGNTVMQHILLGLDTTGLLRRPFRRSWTGPWSGPATLETGLPAGAPLYVFPTFSAFLGGDAVAASLAAGLGEPGPSRLLLDLGTNAEVLLATADGRLWGASAPAGPAFEGVGLRAGRLAGSGAAQRVALTGEVEMEVQGGGPALGLAASALVDLLSELRRVGLLTPDGRLLSPSEVRDPRGWPFRSRLREGPAGREFLLAGELGLAQDEIRRLQLAHGAVASAWRLLLGKAGVAAGDLGEVLLAGTFGHRLNPEAAVRLGLLPDVPIRSLGNAAWEGARLALLSGAYRAAAGALAERITVLELADEPEFQEVFLASLALSPEG